MSKLILVLRESYFWCKTMTWLVEDGLEEATGAISVGAIRYDHDKSLWEISVVTRKRVLESIRF